jgi:outer membrane protein assembly factor BamB
MATRRSVFTLGLAVLGIAAAGWQALSARRPGHGGKSAGNTSLVENAQIVSRKIGSLEGAGTPYTMAVEGNDLIVADGNRSVHVYSIKAFAPKFTIGGKEDEASELSLFSIIWITSDSIVVSDFDKSTWSSRTGEFIKAVNSTDFPDFDPLQGTLLFPAGDRYVRIVSNHPDRRRIVGLFDRELRPIATLHEGLFDWNQTGGTSGFNLLPYRIEVAAGDGEIYVSDTDRGFFIRVFDLEGRTIATIDLTAVEEAVPVSETDREKLLEDVRRTRSENVYNFAKANARFPDTFPRIHEIRYSEGRLYVTTHREKGGLHEMLVLDTRGKVLERLFLPIPSFHHFRGAVRNDLFDVSGGGLFELVQNPETQAWEVLRTDLTRR